MLATKPSDIEAVPRTKISEFRAIATPAVGAMTATCLTDVVGPVTEVTVTVAGFDVSVLPVAELLSVAIAVRV
jgi:hypothetical protein